MVKIIKRILLHVYIYFNGVKFYEYETVPKSPSYKSLEVKTIHGHEIQFYFYEEEINDIRYRYGRFKLDKTKICLLQAQFDQDMPEVVTKYNSLKLTFSRGDLFFDDDVLISSMLISAYLDFITNKENEQKKAIIDLFDK